MHVNFHEKFSRGSWRSGVDRKQFKGITFLVAIQQSTPLEELILLITAYPQASMSLSTILTNNVKIIGQVVCVESANQVLALHLAVPFAPTFTFYCSFHLPWLGLL